MGGSGGSALKRFIAALGNFSVQYNFSCLSMAVAFMGSHWGAPSDKTHPADFPEPDWAKSALAGAVFAGSFVGMIFMGYVGDVVGRRIGMMLTLSIVVVGSLVSAAASWGDAESVYTTICAARFVLGIGVGGIYPMAAATAAENNTVVAAAEDEEIQYDPRHAVDVAKAFFWQTPGSLAPYLVALILTQVPSGPDTTSTQFRIMLGLGAIPATVVLLASYLSAEGGSGSGAAQAKGSEQEGEEEGGHKSSKAGKAGPAPPGPFTIIRANPKWLGALVGTGGVWFLYDVSFYGTSIFTPQILASIFGSGEDLVTLAWQSFLVGAMGLPGIFSAVALLRPAPGQGGEDPEDWPYRSRVLPRFIDTRMCGWTARDLNIWGFILMAVCFLAMAIAYQVYGATGGAQLKFGLFCIIQFSLNWGPNPGTYVQPTQSFPKSIRTTMHGLSAAAGKAGAVVGTFMYAPLKAYAGFAAVMWVQTVLSVLGCAASYFLLPKVAPLVVGQGEGKGHGHAHADEDGAGAIGSSSRSYSSNGGTAELAPTRSSGTTSSASGGSSKARKSKGGKGGKGVGAATASGGSGASTEDDDLSETPLLDA